MTVAAAACEPDATVPDTSQAPVPTTAAPVVATTAPPTTTTTTAPTTTTTAPPVAAAMTTFGPTAATLDGWNIAVAPDPDSTSAIKYDWVGTARFKVVLTADADSLSLVVRGDQCSGAPAYTVRVDEVPLATDSVSTTTYSTKTYARELVAGTHIVDIEYTNDYQPIQAGGCNRNLYLKSLAFRNTTLPGNPAIPAGFVHQSGMQLLDGANRPLKLRGVNVGGSFLWEGWIWGNGFDYKGQTEMTQNLVNLVGPDQANKFREDVYANYLSADDFKAMSHYGINVARIPFNYRMLEDDASPYVYKAAGWAALDRVVAQAKQHNVYLVLDMHAAPCGQALAFTADWSGSTYMWLSQQCQDRATMMWKAIAARYANQNVIAGYDLLNETVTGDAQLLAWYKTTTAAIRSVDRNHTIIYEGNNLARDFGFMGSVPIDSNAMLSVHDYSWMIPGQDVTQRMPKYEAAATALNAPQWAGEFGQSTYEDIDKYAKLFDQSTKFAGWAKWTWKQTPGSPSLQRIQHTAASKKLIDFMNDGTRARPTPAEAQQGMADFINAIKFANTTSDGKLQGIVGR